MRFAPGLTAVDGFLGALLTAVVGLGIAWVLGALALANGGDARRQVQKSVILKELNTVLPPSDGLLAALETRFLAWRDAFAGHDKEH